MLYLLMQYKLTHEFCYYSRSSFRVDVLIAVIRPSLDFQQIWKLAGRANTHSPGSQESLVMVLNPAGTASKNGFSNKIKQTLTATRNACHCQIQCVAYVIQSDDEYRARLFTAYHVAAEDACLNIDTSSHSTITRCGVQKKFKQPLVAQSAVTFSRIHLTLSLVVIINLNTVIINLQGRAPEVARLLSHIVLRSGLYARVSEAPR